ncbi:MAG: hypothetical protein IT205_03060 [Fimbriimonadaceae bacterium]|nr:hypothetical protein [Fimbriimonadaceae bacterium]
MPFTVNEPSEFKIVDAAIRTEVALTAPQLASLKTEYQTDPQVRGYSGKTALEVWKLMVRPYEIPNPVQPQPLVTRTDVLKRDEFVKILNQKQAGKPVFAILQDVPSSDAANYQAARQVLWLAANAETVDFNSAQQGRILNDLKQGGIITNATYKSLTDILDPAWTPTVQKVSRIDAVLGTVGGMLTFAEIAQVMA